VNEDSVAPWLCACRAAVLLDSEEEGFDRAGMQAVRTATGCATLRMRSLRVGEEEEGDVESFREHSSLAARDDTIICTAKSSVRNVPVVMQKRREQTSNKVPEMERIEVKSANCDH
jgi:hypothetical protein